jgi:acetyl esterase/lipase
MISVLDQNISSVYNHPMIHTKHEISVNGQTALLYTYLLDTTKELNGGKKRPVVVICPGGGYEFTSDREAEPIALQMNAAGFNAVILRYSVKPAVFPTALIQLARAVAMVRDHTGDWNSDANRVFVMGFSAGGHLAASLGVLWNKGIIPAEPSLAPEKIKPTGLILAYPVISSGALAHKGSVDNLLAGKNELLETVSLEKQVDTDTPPSFIWHTYEDGAVPVENSLLFAGALRRYGVPFELHVYQYGGHGLSLASAETGSLQPPPNVDTWVDLTVNWIRAFR